MNMNLQFFAAGDRIERKYLAHFIDTSFSATAPTYARLGEDLEEYNIDLSPDVESTKNILGETKNVVKGYEPSSNVDVFYAYEGDPLFTHLSEIVNKRSTGSSLKSTVVDALLTSAGAVTWAFREDVLVIPQSIGGDTGGVQIPYEIRYNGNRVEGDFDVATKEFTPIIP